VIVGRGTRCDVEEAWQAVDLMSDNSVSGRPVRVTYD
jgi:hypothetical protein